MNKIILLGRLTKDPEIRYTQSNEPMAIARYTLQGQRSGLYTLCGVWQEWRVC